MRRPAEWATRRGRAEVTESRYVVHGVFQEEGARRENHLEGPVGTWTCGWLSGPQQQALLVGWAGREARGPPGRVPPSVYFRLHTAASSPSPQNYQGHFKFSLCSLAGTDPRAQESTGPLPPPGCCPEPAPRAQAAGVGRPPGLAVPPRQKTCRPRGKPHPQDPAQACHQPCVKWDMADQELHLWEGLAQHLAS